MVVQGFWVFFVTVGDIVLSESENLSGRGLLYDTIIYGK